MIFIIQPAIPKYREPFFDRLSVCNDIKVVAAEKDFLGVKSTCRAKYVSYAGSFKRFLGNRAFWHCKLPLWKAYKRGDVVVVNGNPRVINYMLLLTILKFRGIKTVWWGHGWSAASRGLSASIRLSMMYFLSDYQLVYTDCEKRHLKKETVYALNNGLDSKSIQSAIEKAENRTSAKTLYSGKVSLFFIGRVTKKSNFDFLLKALEKVQGDFLLHVIGTERVDIIDSYPDVREKVIWHGEVYEEVEIARIVKDLDFFVYPGAVGLSLIHAFNYGKPAILHSKAEYHMPEFSAFSEGVNGYSYVYGDIDSFVETLETVLSSSKEELEKLSIGARGTVTNTYNVEDMACRFNRLISRVNS